MLKHLVFTTGSFTSRKNCSSLYWLAACLALTVLSSPSFLLAAFNTSGDISPSNPATWTWETACYIGKTANGSLTVNNSSDLLSWDGYLGYARGVTGEVIVNGAGSTWIPRHILYIGYNGNGKLAITNSGAIYDTIVYIGYGSSSTGMVTVDGAGSIWHHVGHFVIGDAGSGILTITDGGVVSGNLYGYIGGDSGSTGKVTVDGIGSTWITDNRLYVGSSGNGTMTVTNSGMVSDNEGYIGRSSGSTGTVTVSGASSTWTNSSNLYVGYGSNGMLTISDGGLVSAGGVLSIGDDGLVNIGIDGMLALMGQANSLADYLNLINGTDNIRYWDYSTMGWSDINNAVEGVNYTLSYMNSGNLAGYTVLAVIPEPTTLILLAFGTFLAGRKRRK
jgi:T5SS/PEP-CTERM-associated repeat protein